MTHRSWTVLCAVMLYVGLLGPLVLGGPAAQSVASQAVEPDLGVGESLRVAVQTLTPTVDSAAWKDELPQHPNATGGQGAGGDVIGSLPEHLVAPPDDLTSVFHIGPYLCNGVPVSKDIHKNAGETEDHFDGRCANAFNKFVSMFPPDPKTGSH